MSKAAPEQKPSFEGKQIANVESGVKIFRLTSHFALSLSVSFEVSFPVICFTGLHASVSGPQLRRLCESRILQDAPRPLLPHSRIHCQHNAKKA